MISALDHNHLPVPHNKVVSSMVVLKNGVHRGTNAIEELLEDKLVGHHGVLGFQPRLELRLIYPPRTLNGLNFVYWTTSVRIPAKV